MKFFILVPFLFIVLFAVRAQGHIMEQLMDCGEKLGVSPDDMQKLLNGDFSNGGAPENIMCVPQCVLENTGVMKDGSIDENAIIQNIGHHIPDDKIDELKSVINECKAESGDLECETPFKIFNCVMGYMSKYKPDHDHQHGRE